MMTTLLLAASLVGLTVSAPGSHYNAYYRPYYYPSAYSQPFTAFRRYGYKFVDPQPETAAAITRTSTAAPRTATAVPATSFNPTADSNVILDTPSAKAALAYLAEDLGSCSEQSKAYITTYIDTGDEAAATKAAEAVYRADYSPDLSNLSPACQAAEKAYRASYAAGQSPILPSALAFIDAYNSDSACAASARTYIQSINQGKTSVQAALDAFKSFAAKSSDSVDAVCVKSAQAFIANSASPASPISAAMTAFITKALETGSGFDPICAAASESYATAYAAGQSTAEATEAAAVSFLDAVGDSAVYDENTACGLAAKAFIDAYEA